MSGNSFFHCKFQIQRPGYAYELNEDSIQGPVELFLQKNQAPYFTIGSSPDSYIHLKNLAANHLTCIFAAEDLILHAKKPFSVTCDNRRLAVEADQRINIHIEYKSNSFTWKMTFDDKTRIAGRLVKAPQILANNGYCYLEAQYGKLTKIQEGKSSLIYKTDDRRILKILRPDFVQGSKNVTRRFINAARKYQQIIHPDFLPIYEIVYQKQHNLCFVVTENFPGESLRNYLGRRGPLDWQESLKIAHDLAKKLCVLEEYGYVCRNLNPGNVIRSADGELRITSFFLLKSDVHLTLQARMIIPNYTAPEQVTDPSAADILSDIFSLGAIFYHMLLGSPPFQTTTTGQYIENISSGLSICAQDITNIAPHLPVELCRVIAQMLSFEHKKRPTPQELLQLFARYEEKKDALSDSCMELIDASCRAANVLQDLQKEKPEDEDALMMDKFSANFDMGLAGMDQQDINIKLSESLIESLKPDEQNVAAMPKTSLEIPNEEKESALSESYLELVECLQDDDEGPEIFTESTLQKIDKACAAKGYHRKSTEIITFLEKIEQTPPITLQNKEAKGYCLSIIQGPPGTEFVEYSFSGDHTVIIGREGGLRIPYDYKVSRKHAQLEVVDNRAFLKDLGSANGVWIKSRRIEQCEIFPGTHFTIGDTEVVFNNSHSTMAGILEDPKKELTEEDISQVKLLKITSAYPAFGRSSGNRWQ